MFSLEKIKEDPNAVPFYTGFENYDALIYSVLESKASKMHFWEKRCKDGT